MRWQLVVAASCSLSAAACGEDKSDPAVDADVASDATIDVGSDLGHDVEIDAPSCVPADPTDGAIDTFESYSGRCNPVCTPDQFCVGSGTWWPFDDDAGDRMVDGGRGYCFGCHLLPAACASTPTCDCLVANLPIDVCGKRMLQCRMTDGVLRLRCGDCPCPK